MLASDQLPGECRIDVQALPLQAAIGQQAVSALDTMLLFRITADGAPQMRDREHRPMQGRHHIHEQRGAPQLVHVRTDLPEQPVQYLSCLHGVISVGWYPSWRSPNIEKVPLRNKYR